MVFGRSLSHLPRPDGEYPYNPPAFLSDVIAILRRLLATGGAVPNLFDIPLDSDQEAAVATLRARYDAGHTGSSVGRCSNDAVVWGRLLLDWLRALPEPLLPDVGGLHEVCAEIGKLELAGEGGAAEGRAQEWVGSVPRPARASLMIQLRFLLQAADFAPGAEDSISCFAAALAPLWLRPASASPTLTPEVVGGFGRALLRGTAAAVPGKENVAPGAGQRMRARQRGAARQVPSRARDEPTSHQVAKMTSAATASADGRVRLIVWADNRTPFPMSLARQQVRRRRRRRRRRHVHSLHSHAA